MPLCPECCHWVCGSQLDLWVSVQRHGRHSRPQLPLLLNWLDLICTFLSQIHLSVISMLIIIFQQYDFTRSSLTIVQVQSCLWFTRSTFWPRRFARRWASVRFHKRRWKTRRGWKRRWKMEETKLCGSIKARFFKFEKKLFLCECFFKCQTFKTKTPFSMQCDRCAKYKIPMTEI